MQEISELKNQLDLPSPLQRVYFSEWKSVDVEIYIKRDDKIHPAISGNKYRKLSGHLSKFYQGNYEGIITFGGAYSNHILATAAACSILKIPAIGIIRGEIDEHNPALKYATSQGMKLIPLARQFYKQKDYSKLKSSYSDIHFESWYEVPEGGSGRDGLSGCAGILEELNMDFDYYVTACGTGTTAAGLLKYSSPSSEIIGVSVLKGPDRLTEHIHSLCPQDNIHIITGYHFGGYAKTQKELLVFARKFIRETGIPLDYVYTAKMIYAVDDMLKKNWFKTGSKIMLLHTGGLVNAPIQI